MKAVSASVVMEQKPNKEDIFQTLCHFKYGRQQEGIIIRHFNQKQKKELEESYLSQQAATKNSTITRMGIAQPNRLTIC